MDKKDPTRLIEVHHNSIQSYPFSDIGDLVYNMAKNDFQPWEYEAPIVLSLQGFEIPGWRMYKNSAADPPSGMFKTKENPEQIFLVPYGCTRLRISEFPVVTDN